MKILINSEIQYNPYNRVLGEAEGGKQPSSLGEVLRALVLSPSCIPTLGT